MIRTAAVLLLLAAGLATATGAPAQPDPTAVVHLDPWIGAFVFDDDEVGAVGREVDVGWVVGARVGVPIGPRWEIEGGYGFAPLTSEASEFRDELDAGQVDLDLHLAYAGVNVRFGGDAATRLVLGAGFGVAAVRPDRGRDQTDPVVRIGVGFSHPLNDRLALRGDLEDHVQFCDAPDLSVVDLDPGAFLACLDDDPLNHIAVSGGLQIALGPGRRDR